jgi:magnesium-transporting ATPase (P-type)
MWPDLASARELSTVMGVLSAMITPAVLILASGSLIMTTSSRSIRCIDRIRERASELEALGKGTDVGTETRRQHLFFQLEINIRRARLLQKAMSRLYVAISSFIATSVSIGLVALLQFDVGWVPLLFDFIGAALLFSASIYLIFESRMALTTTDFEMDFISRTYMQQDKQ